MEITKTKIFGIGASGLVGSRITELLTPTFQIDNLSSETGIDITNPLTLSALEDDTDHRIVLHLAAKTDVDGCELDKDAGEQGLAWRINVEGTKNVIKACKKNNKKLIYVSTDFVFDGTKPLGELYTEDNTPNPLNWYAVTKRKGEELVSESGLDYVILRLAYPYRSPFANKKDLVQVLLTRLQEGKPIAAVTDHIMSPTFVDDFAEAIKAVITQNGNGIYHVVGSQHISPYNLTLLLAKTFSLDTSLVSETTRNAFFAGRAVRPFNLGLNNARIEKLGVKMRTVEEGLIALKQQVDL